MSQASKVCKVANLRLLRGITVSPWGYGSWWQSQVMDMMDVAQLGSFLGRTLNSDEEKLILILLSQGKHHI